MFKNKILIFIILITALLSISVASAEESSINATDDSSMEVVTSVYDENTSLDVVSKDNIETFKEDSNTLKSGDNTIFSNNALSLNEATQNELVETSKTFTQLNDTISRADSTLVLDSNYTMTNDDKTNFADGITISKNIIIDGNGFTIDANGLGRIFNITSGCTVSLTNVTLANGNHTYDGGAIYNSGTLTLTNITFNNSAGRLGGAIYNGASGLTVSGCSFVNNFAIQGGAIYNRGSGFVSNSTFNNNRVSDAGGAICNWEGEFNMSSCIFVNNSANYNKASKGGVIYNYFGMFNVTNSVLVNNTSPFGNAFYSHGGSGQNPPIINDNWWGTNTPDWNKLVYCYYAEVVRESYAVLNLTASNNIAYLNFYKNGTTEVLNNIPPRSLNLTIGNQEYSTEISDGSFKQEYTSPVGDYNVTAVVDNQKLAISFINSVYVDPVNGKDDDEAYDGFSWDKAVQSISKAMNIVQPNGKIYLSDGIHIVDSKITIDKTVVIVGNGTKTFITNNKTGNGVFYVVVDNVTISNCNFVNNSKDSKGGAILNYGPGLTVSNCSFINNTAKEYGGAIWNYGPGFIVSNSIFVNNSAEYDGGAIDNIASDFTVTNSVFVNNSAGRGNAIYAGDYLTANDNWWGSNTPDWTSLFDGSGEITHDTYAVLSLTASNNISYLNFYKNGTTNALKIPTRSLNLTIDNQEYLTKITDGTFNQGYSAPAGEYNVTAVVDNQKLVISFLNNVYVDSNGNDANTGADWNNAVKTIEHAMEIVLANGNIYLADGTHEVDSQIAIDKTVAIVGNGTKTFITNNKNNNSVFKVTVNNVAIYNSTFVNNTVKDWMGIIAVWYDVSGFTVGGCSFINNSAHYGGAIYNDGSNLTVSNSTFINNSAYYYGGAIYNYGSGFTLSDCGFVNNSAYYYGGAIYNYGSDFAVNNCSFINNSAEYGSAITNWGADSIVDNSTFINNSANGGAAIANANVNFTIKDSSFINNSGEFGVIYNDEEGTLNLNNNTYSGISEGKTYIYLNNGTLSSVVVTVLGNGTVKTQPGENITLYATITCDEASVAGGVLNFTIDGVNYIADSQNNGIYKCNYKVAFDNCEIVSASFANATNSTIQTGILDARNHVNLTVNDVVMIYHDGTRLIANLLDAKGNPIANTTISFTINGVTYNRTTNANGTASLAINLNYGLYNAVVLYSGNETYSLASVNATVEIKSSIIGQNLVKMYQNNTHFFATFIDLNGNPLVNTTVIFNINGVFYTRDTDVNGTAKLNINLNPGNYTLTAINPETGEQQGFNVLVKSLIEADDLTKYYNNESKFQAKIYNKDGSIAINKSVTFNINGVLYTRQTDENGTVKLAINLRPGNYTITTTYEGLSIGNKVEVLPTLITNDLTMTYKDGSKFNATVLDSHGNPLANQTIRFNVNGIFYNRTTDSNGIASLNINLFRGKYIITSIWNEYQTGNKITIS